jgi:hypothetical protein
VVTPWCSYDEQNARVSVVYNDHSLYIWDVRDVRKVGKSHSFLFHSACIWGLEVPYVTVNSKIFMCSFDVCIYEICNMLAINWTKEC